MTEARSVHLRPLVGLFDMSSRMLEMALADLKNADALTRTREGRGSSITYVTGHLMYARTVILNLVGAHQGNAFQDLFGWGVPIREASAYPEIQEIRKEWSELAQTFQTVLCGLSDEQVLTPYTGGMPGPDPTIRGTIEGLCWHESYHLGQVGLIRTELGYPTTEQLFRNAHESG